MKNFNIPEVTEYGKNQLESLETVFTNATADILCLVPAGRESAVITTKMQEAFLFAYQAICHAHKRNA